jgi:folate-binding protein YgfZ
MNKINKEIVMALYYRLSHLKCIRCKGENTLAFLQGQVTADINEVNDKKGIRSAVCQLNGKIIAFIFVIQHQNDYCLIMDSLAYDTLIKAWTLVAKLSKVTFSLDNKIELIGEINLTPDKINASYPFYQESRHTRILLHNQEERLAIDDEIVNDIKTWIARQALDGIIKLSPNTIGKFLPHDLSLQKSDLINFNKGCYKGQEIIARMHYKATIKFELKWMTTNENKSVVLGDPFYTENGILLGYFIDKTSLANGEQLIAISAKKELMYQPLYFGENTGQLSKWQYLNG